MPVEMPLNEKLEWIRLSLPGILPELLLALGLLLILLAGLNRKVTADMFPWTTAALLALSALYTGNIWHLHGKPVWAFSGMVRNDTFALYLKLLFDIAGILTVLLTTLSKAHRQNGNGHTDPTIAEIQKHRPEFYALLLAIVLGAHLLVMSMNLVMAFISLELISIASYVLAGFSFTRQGAEGSLKYFLFGSVASAIMLYGFSILYGLTGTLNFSDVQFATQLQHVQNSPLFFTAGLMALAGFFYKITAAPMHPWAPDVYEAAPTPVIAFFSVVPKLAGIGVLSRFVLAINAGGLPAFDWQAVLSIVAMLTLTIGNFSALSQKNPKRLMAYSSIAQSGFLLVGVVAFLPQGTQFMLFYASVYVVMSYLVFLYVQYFEDLGFTTIPSFAGAGRAIVWPSVFMLTGFIALTGLPPTAGFTAKLFIFSSLWEAYQVSNKPVLLVLLIFGLLNTVVALFYYLRIPYYAFIKNGETSIKTNNLTFENLLGLILVLSILILFFSPGQLMGWINKINFVL